MKTEDIINSIRAISKNETPCIDISNILYSHKCIELLSKTKSKYSSDLEMKTFLSRIAIKERYTALKPFFESDSLTYAVIKGAVL